VDVYPHVRENAVMLNGLIAFVVHWGLLTLALWVASHIFKGISFTSNQALWASSLLLGFVNAIVRPVLVWLTLPLTLLTLGLFLLVINACMMMLVSSLVEGFKLKSFWTAFFASLFIAVFSFFLDAAIFGGGTLTLSPPTHGVQT